MPHDRMEERGRTACLSIVGDPGPGDLALFVPIPVPVFPVFRLVAHRVTGR